MALGLSVALPYRGQSLLNPSTLFAGGEQGGWYDPSDLSTLFQDSAGTTRVTALGQAVGLILDKSRGLALGSELRGTGTTALVGTATAASYNTSTGVATVTRVDAANQSYVQITGLSAGTYFVRISGVSGTSGAMRVRTEGPGGATQLEVANGGAGVARVSVAAGASLFFTTGGVAGNASFTIETTAIIAGNHLTQASATSRPLLQQDASGAFHLQFDGFDDFLTAGTFKMSASDKVTVCAGLRKISTTTAVAVELSAASTTNNGAFGIFAPDGAVQYTFASRGTALATASTSDAQFAAPQTGVIVGVGDIAADGCSLRIGGVQRGVAASDQGTGNYGAAYPLFVGRRAGTTLPFNGNLYGLVIRGTAATTTQIAALERYMARQTGIAL